MRRVFLRRFFVRVLITLGILYILLCALMYFFQEALIFHPKPLSRDYEFAYVGDYNEINIRAEDGTYLNGLLFKSDSSKGLFFYLHGNAGALDTWGKAAYTYVALGYDCFILDYRGYGKSEGQITSEEQFYGDIQLFYDSLKRLYEEKNIIIAGYSIGTGPAAQLASVNNPKMLLLQAPYYSLTDMMQHTYPFVPIFLLKYKFATNEFIQKTKAPVVIFHGDADEIIYYGASEKLKGHFKPGDTLITLKGMEHNGMNSDETYKKELARVLNTNNIVEDYIGYPSLEDLSRLRKELVSNYSKVYIMDTTFYNKSAQRVRVKTTYRCLFDKGLIVPGRYVWEDTTHEFVTHNFVQDICILIDADTIFNKTIDKIPFAELLPNEQIQFGTITHTGFNYDKQTELIEFGYTIGIPVTDVAITMSLFVDKRGGFTVSDR